MLFFPKLIRRIVLLRSFDAICAFEDNIRQHTSREHLYRIGFRAFIITWTWNHGCNPGGFTERGPPVPNRFNLVLSGSKSAKRERELISAIAPSASARKAHRYSLVRRSRPL